jgi:hypothetical protein
MVDITVVPKERRRCGIRGISRLRRFLILGNSMNLAPSALVHADIEVEEQRS